MSLPKDVHYPGWPEFLTDYKGDDYVRLRDGSDAAGPTGNPCIYGLLNSHGYIDRSNQWIPALGATESNMTLTPGIWDDEQVFINAGVPPIEIPEEPVRVPRR